MDRTCNFLIIRVNTHNLFVRLALAISQGLVISLKDNTAIIEFLPYLRWRVISCIHPDDFTLLSANFNELLLHRGGCDESERNENRVKSGLPLVKRVLPFKRHPRASRRFVIHNNNCDNEFIDTNGVSHRHAEDVWGRTSEDDVCFFYCGIKSACV